MRKFTVIVAAVLLGIILAACGKTEDAEVVPTSPDNGVGQSGIEETIDSGSDEEDGKVSDMIMEIGNTKVHVDWEENESVEALRKLVSKEPLTIRMSMYGGFEQVGPIGQELPRDDKKITTEAGDIVLYSGNQLVVFYGSNSWDYTRLGAISDKSKKELTELLGNGDVTITIK